MEGVNLVAVGVAAIAAMTLGGLWYSPLLFEKPWRRSIAGGDDEGANGNPVVVYGLAFVWMLVGAFVFAMFIGPDPELGFALGAGAGAGFAWVAGSLSISYLFEGRATTAHLINGGFHTLQYTLYGLVLGLM